MLNFMSMCLDHSLPRIWLNMISASVRVFPDKISMGIHNLSRADCPPQCGWVSPLRGGSERSRKVEEG